MGYIKLISDGEVTA